MAAPALVAALLALPGAAAADGWTDLVRAGERWWRAAPEGSPPVACATCHRGRAETDGWVASFPKWRPLPPPHARVMTLTQALAEAAERHYPAADRQRVAVALAAYLTARAAGVTISPGVAPDQLVFPHRLAALAASAERGARRFARRCAACHPAEDVAPAVVRWWALVRRAGDAPERFLERHPPDGPRPAWDSAETADVLAYLVGRQAGRRLSPPEGGSP